MIIVRLWGGIGNQLFQYSFGEFLREKYKMKVVYDIASFGTSDILRKLELKILVSNLPITLDISFSKYTGIKNRLFKLSYSLRNTFIEEDFFSEKYLLKALKKGDVYLQGYWQSPLYIDAIKKKGIYLPNECCPSQLVSLMTKICNTPDSIALHVRRGDYFNSKNASVFGVCDVQYYEKALALMKSKVVNSTIFIFSDDLDWVKKNLNLPTDSIYVPNYDVPQYWYIYLMSLCENNIISNSTFSWWGAVLNTNINKIVVAPAVWTLNSSRSIVLDDWVKL